MSSPGNRAVNRVFNLTAHPFRVTFPQVLASCGVNTPVGRGLPDKSVEGTCDIRTETSATVSIISIRSINSLTTLDRGFRLLSHIPDREGVAIRGSSLPVALGSGVARVPCGD